MANVPVSGYSYTYPSKTRAGLPPPNDPNFSARMRETMLGYLGQQGDRLDRGVTLRDLASAGIQLSATFMRTGKGDPFGDGLAVSGPGGGTTVIGGPGSIYVPDLTPPPSPTGFDATAGLSYVIVECDAPTYTVGHGHSHSILYGLKRDPAVAPVFGNAVELAQFGGPIYAYPTEPSTQWYFWLKWVSVDGVASVSPAGGANGVSVQTGLNVSNMLDAITEAANNPAAPFTKLAIRSTMFYVVSDIPGVPGTPPEIPMFSVITAPITNNGVTVPVGVYIPDAYIKNGTITNLKVGNAAIDNAKIANVSASKLTAGTISIGEYIQSAGYVASLSGWKINGAGNAELNNVVVRGFGYFGGGDIGGIIIEATRIRSSNYTGATDGTGFMLHSNGTLDLPDGAINAQKLNIGFGSNLLQGSTWMVRNGSLPEGWTYGGSLSYMTTLQVDQGVWMPAGGKPTLYMVQSGRNGDTNINTAYTDLYGGKFPVEPGRRYEYSVYTGAHRCTGIALLVFRNAAGDAVQINYSTDPVTGNVGSNAGEKQGGQNLSLFKRIGGFGTAPTTAASAELFIRKGDTYAGATDSYLFMNSPYVGAASARQTIFSPYNSTGLGVLITPAGISTPSIAALSANLGAITAGQIRINSDGAGQWGYIGSTGKWRDGNWGWVMAQHPNGSNFIDFTIGSCTFWMHHIAGVSATMVMDTPGLYFDSNGTVQLRQQSIVNTGNIVANAVTVPSFTELDDVRRQFTAWNAQGPVLQIFNLDSQGSPIYLNGSAECTMEGYGGDPQNPNYEVHLVLLRSDGAVVWAKTSRQVNGRIPIVGWFGGAGNAHYSLYIGPTGGFGSIVVRNRNMFLMGVRR